MSLGSFESGDQPSPRPDEITDLADEFWNALTAVIGLAQTLARDEVAASAELRGDLAGSLDRAARRVMGAAEGLLALATPAAGAGLDVRDLAAAIARGRGPGRLRIDVPEGCPRVRGAFLQLLGLLGLLVEPALRGGPARLEAGWTRDDILLWVRPLHAEPVPWDAEGLARQAALLGGRADIDRSGRVAWVRLPQPGVDGGPGGRRGMT